MSRLNPGAASIAALALGALALGGCASEKYVNEHVAMVDSKAAATQSQVDAQQASLKDQDGRLSQLDQTSRDALERAQAAGITKIISIGRSNVRLWRLRSGACIWCASTLIAQASCGTAR